MRTKACLVTGGAGFIGSHVAEALLNLGHRVRIVDNLSTGSESNLDGFRERVEFVLGDLTDPRICERVVDGVEWVFHLAALPSVPRSMKDPWASHEHNAAATLRLLIAARDAKVGRVVYSSSSSVYGDTPVLPKVETMEPLPRSPYAVAKLSGEQYVLSFARAGLVEGAALRYFNVFGPRQTPNSAYAAVIPSFMAAARDGTPARLFGDGEQTRDFTFVRNVVHANLLAAGATGAAANGVVVNCGAGGRTSLLDLVHLIEVVSGRPVPLERQAPRPGDVRDSLASLDRARALFGYEPITPLKEGLEETWQWFCEGAPAAPA